MLVIVERTDLTSLWTGLVDTKWSRVQGQILEILGKRRTGDAWREWWRSAVATWSDWGFRFAKHTVSVQEFAFRGPAWLPWRKFLGPCLKIMKWGSSTRSAERGNRLQAGRPRLRICIHAYHKLEDSPLGKRCRSPVRENLGKKRL